VFALYIHCVQEKVSQNVFVINVHVFTVRLHVMQCMHGITKACPSVKRVDCDKGKETCAHILYHMKDHSS